MIDKSTLSVLGNGDSYQGARLIDKLAQRLIEARNKHKWGMDKEISDPRQAYRASLEENGEWLFAMNEESFSRQTSEALDILAVAVRMYNQEFLQ